MNEATIAQTILSLVLLVVFDGFFIWGRRSGQFHNVEDSKHHFLREEEPKGDTTENKNLPGGGR